MTVKPKRIKAPNDRDSRKLAAFESNGKPKIYIAASCLDKHGVEMLMYLLKLQGFEVISFYEIDYSFSIEWINHHSSVDNFQFHNQAIAECNLFIYYGPPSIHQKKR